MTKFQLIGVSPKTEYLLILLIPNGGIANLSVGQIIVEQSIATNNGNTLQSYNTNKQPDSLRNAI